jgi:integrase
MGKLTQAKLKGLLDRPGRYGDGDGLFFRSLGQNRGYWVYRYRSPDPENKGKERELSLGPFPELGVLEARAKHIAMRMRVVNDKVDPLGEKRAAKQVRKAEAHSSPTFGKVANRYLDEQEALGQLGNNPVHRRQWRTTLAKLPLWFSNLPVDEIGPQQVHDALKPIWTATPETGSRLRGRIAAVLDDARGPDDTHANPVAWTGWLKKKLGDPRKLGKIDGKTGERVPRGNHAAMPYADVPAFMAKLKTVDGVAAKALRFLILTGARSGEVFGAGFDEIALDYSVVVDQSGERLTVPAWLVPGERMKMSEPHRVPLSDEAIEIVRGQLSMRGEKQTLLFESPIAQGRKVHRNGGHQPLSAMSLTMTMRRLGAGDFTPHGFRSSFRDWATEAAKADWATAEKSLAHAVGNKSSQAYDRSDRFLLRQPLMQSWANYLLQAESDNLVNISSARGKREAATTP